MATGSTPRHLQFGGEQIIYFRTLNDYQWLRGLTKQGQRFAVIGGGFIGSEIAAALASVLDPVDGYYDLGPGPRQSQEEQQQAHSLSKCMNHRR